jgi:hypothetical protein
MALVVASVKNELFAAFKAMTDGDDKVFSGKVSAAVKTFAESGSIVTSDAGAIPSGAFVGAGTGGISVEDAICERIVYAACMAMNSMMTGGDEYLAAQVVAGIHAMICAGSVDTDVTGTLTPPGSPPVPLSGKACGTMLGEGAPMQRAFQAAFTSMYTMREGGDDYMAQQMATAIDAYLKGATINTMGSAHLAGSAGSGKMT